MNQPSVGKDKIDAFLADLADVCKRHGLMIEPTAEGGEGLTVWRLSHDGLNQLMAADDATMY